MSVSLLHNAEQPRVMHGPGTSTSKCRNRNHTMFASTQHPQVDKAASRDRTPKLRPHTPAHTETTSNSKPLTDCPEERLVVSEVHGGGAGDIVGLLADIVHKPPAIYEVRPRRLAKLAGEVTYGDVTAHDGTRRDRCTVKSTSQCGDGNEQKNTSATRAPRRDPTAACPWRNP